MQSHQNANLSPQPAQPANTYEEMLGATREARGDVLKGVHFGGRHETVGDAEAMAYAASTSIDKFLHDEAEAVRLRSEEQAALVAGDDEGALDKRVDAKMLEWSLDRTRRDAKIEAAREVNVREDLRQWARGDGETKRRRGDPLEKAYKAPSATDPRIEDNKGLYSNKS